MPRPLFSESIATDNPGPLVIGTGLAIVLASQLWPVVPLAAAIALIGLGATLTLKHRQNQGFMALNFVIYASLVALAIVAQINLHDNLLTQCDAILALILTVAAIPQIHIGSR